MGQWLEELPHHLQLHPIVEFLNVMKVPVGLDFLPTAPIGESTRGRPPARESFRLALMVARVRPMMRVVLKAKLNAILWELFLPKQLPVELSYSRQRQRKEPGVF